jgi:type IV pilus assembly protein PilF
MQIIKGLLLIIVFLELTACNLQQNDHIIKTNSAAAKDNMQLGMAYLQQGDRVRAKHKLLLALQQDKNSAQVQDAMAYFLEITGELQQAEIYYQRALQLAPKSGVELNNYGVFLCHLGKYAESENQFLAAVQDPNYLNTAKAYENAGLCAQQIPDVDKATKFFLLAVKQDPNLAMAWFELAQINYKEGHEEIAEQYMANYWRLNK